MLTSKSLSSKCLGSRWPRAPIITSNWWNTFCRHHKKATTLNTYFKANGHWAFVTDDIHADFERMKALGVKFKADKPVAIEAGVNKGGFAIYLFDLDGITLELLQPPSKEQAELNKPS